MYVCQVIHIPYICMYSMCSAKCVHKEELNLISQIKTKTLLCYLAYYTIRTYINVYFNYSIKYYLVAYQVNVFY